MMSSATRFPWPQGRRAALSLTYDDAHTGHHESVAPFLAQHGFHATFYVPISGRFLEESEAWRAVAKSGHELGNHTLFHPCYSEKGEHASWLDPGYNLRDYSLRRWQDEVRVANWALRQIDGRTERTFGNTCGDRHIGQGESRTCLDGLMPPFFVAARGKGTGQMIDPHQPDFFNLGHAGADGKTFAELQAQLTQVREAGGWMIYTMHAVGTGSGNLFIEKEEHRRLVDWLAAGEDFWVAPVVEIARWLRQNRPTTA